MTCRLALTLWLVLCVPVFAAPAAADERAAVAAVLDRLHERAAAADYDGYFALFAEDAVFMGTDRSEYWPLAEFRAYTRQRFNGGVGWTYIPLERAVHVHADVAWFEERLQHARFGEFRGTGVLLREQNQWRIRQYNLTLPMPNELFESLGERIVEHYGAEESP